MKEGYIYLVIGQNWPIRHYMQMDSLICCTGQTYVYDEDQEYMWCEGINDDGHVLGQWIHPDQVIEIGKL